MALVKVGNKTFKVERVDNGVFSCDKCGERSGCMKSVVEIGSGYLPSRYCYGCTGNHWKKALKIHREITLQPD